MKWKLEQRIEPEHLRRSRGVSPKDRLDSEADEVQRECERDVRDMLHKPFEQTGPVGAVDDWPRSEWRKRCECVRKNVTLVAAVSAGKAFARASNFVNHAFKGRPVDPHHRDGWIRRRNIDPLPQNL
jgi:hypothetical protein